MSAPPPTLEIQRSADVPRLLVELPSWRKTFLNNVRDFVSPPAQAPLQLRSAPAPFWHDVFVKRELPWEGLIRSSGVHLVACGLILGLTHLFAVQPQAVTTPAFDHSQVIYYNAPQDLPPLDTRSETSAAPRKADSEFSKQPVISVPAEAENREQTIVTPPKIKLQRETRIPNIVAWSDTSKKPQLEVPPAPLTPAAEITRIAPRLNDTTVAPPPDAARLNRQRNSTTMQNSVVAPPPDVRAANNTPLGFSPLQPAVVAPPPSLDNATSRLSDITIARSAVIAPAPQFPVEAQRSLPGGRPGSAGALATQVVPPPPSMGTSSNSGASSGVPGRVIALNLHPAVGAPPDPPAGNRRGTFAATPEGHAGASGAPGSVAGNSAVSDPHGKASGKGDGATSHKGSSDLPAGLYVGNTAEKTSAVAGNPGNSTANSVNPNLIANVTRPRVTTAPSRPMQPDSAAKLSEAERTVFGNRRFYSVSLNMPNLNSAGGSWVIRFAELRRDSVDPIHRDENAATVDLSQPMATRKVDPAYPTQLMRENVAGTVILYAIIHADGSVDSVRILQGADERLNRFASEAVAQWKFDPATKNGAPVDVEATFRIPFKPAKMGSNF